jgi:glyoxylase-like metal-dependent hydrolase (beta-lactamase superfamily II)
MDPISESESKSKSKWKTGMIEVAPGTYAYVQATGGWFINNAGLIVGKEDAIVVDSLANAKMAKKFISEIKKITDKPLSHLINTHHHTDHTWTNYLFPAKTICHRRCREETVKEMNMDPKLYPEIFTGLDVTGAKVTPQDITFEKELTIYQEMDGGEREIKLIYAGPAHTVSDVFVHLPQERAIFCGDLLFSEPCTPFALMGSISGYISALDRLATLDAEVYIPGHGPLSRKEALYKARGYLKFVQEEAHKKFEEGVEAYDAARTIDLGAYANWNEGERIVGNVERAYSELRGEPPGTELPNFLDIMFKMMEYRKELE